MLCRKRKTGPPLIFDKCICSFWKGDESSSALLGNGWEHPVRWVPFSQHGLSCLTQSPKPHVKGLQHDHAESPSTFTPMAQLSFQAQHVILGSFRSKGNVGSVCNPARNVRVAVITSWADRPHSQQPSDWIPSTQSS